MQIVIIYFLLYKMPYKCCVVTCKSNYDTEKETTVGSFLTRSDEQTNHDYKQVIHKRKNYYCHIIVIILLWAGSPHHAEYLCCEALKRPPVVPTPVLLRKRPKIHIFQEDEMSKVFTTGQQDTTLNTDTDTGILYICFEDLSENRCTIKC